MVRIGRIIIGSLFFVTSLGVTATGPAGAVTAVPEVTGPLPVSADSYPFGAADHQLVPAKPGPGRVRRGGVPGRAGRPTSTRGRRPDRPSSAPRPRRTPPGSSCDARPGQATSAATSWSRCSTRPTCSISTSAGRMMHRQLIGNGDAWVGVTVKPVSVVALQTFDPVRYGGLSMANPLPLDDPRNCAEPITVIPGDSSRTTENGSGVGHLHPGRCVAPQRRPDEPADLPGPAVGRARSTASGTRRPAATCTTTSTASSRWSSRPTGVPMYDGYIVAVAGGAFVGAVADEPVRAAAPTRRSAPTVHQRRGADHPRDVAVRLPHRDRRPAARRRPPARPVPPLRDGRRRPRHARRALLLGRPGRHRAGRPGRPTRSVQRGAPQPVPEQHLLRRHPGQPRPWVRDGVPPPRVDPITVVDGAPVVDEFGNVVGGLRSPYLDVPTSTWFGSATGASFCFIAGWERPFTQDVLDRLYPSHGAYVSRVTASVDQLVDQRIITAYDGRRLIHGGRPGRRAMTAQRAVPAAVLHLFGSRHAEAATRSGVRSPRPARRRRPPPAGSPVPRPPARNGHAAGPGPSHARRARPWRCEPA